MVGPRIGPSTVGTPTRVMTRPIRAGPEARANAVWPTGRMRPPPTPWMTRKATSEPIDQAKPHNADPRVNRMIEPI